VSTVRFQIPYVFLVLAHERRRIVHFAVTAHLTAEWTAHQLREAFPWDSAPQYLLRDRDRIFGHEFVEQVKAMGSFPSPCETEHLIHRVMRQNQTKKKNIRTVGLSAVTKIADVGSP
jgi:hypothetical protein